MQCQRGSQPQLRRRGHAVSNGEKATATNVFAEAGPAGHSWRHNHPSVVSILCLAATERPRRQRSVATAGRSSSACGGVGAVVRVADNYKKKIRSSDVLFSLSFSSLRLSSSASLLLRGPASSWRRCFPVSSPLPLAAISASFATHKSADILAGWDSGGDVDQRDDVPSSCAAAFVLLVN